MTWQMTTNEMNRENLLTEESLFFLGNGYIGVRGNFEETYGKASTSIRGTYINAFHDVIDISYGEKLFAFPDTQQKMLNVLDGQTIHISIGGEHFSMDEGEVLDFQRELKLDEGISVRNIHWRSPSGKEVKLTFKRLVSFVHRELFMIQVGITPLNFEDTITVLSSLEGDVQNYVNPDDPRVAAGHAKRLHVQESKVEGKTGYIRSRAQTSELDAACLTYHRGMEDARVTVTEESGQRVHFQFEVEGKNDKTLQFTKYNLYGDSMRQPEGIESHLRSVKEELDGLSDGELFAEQKKYMNDFWKHSDVRIEGEEELQEGIRFNLFHLLQSVGRDRFSNISAKGLSGEGYEGHYFWDTEIYMFPVFLMTAPELAKQLLIYRHSILDGARKRAMEMGHRQGALFPWRTINGDECSAFFPAGTAQYHISGDIAYSYLQYYHATNDVAFMKNYGVEVLIETARLWIDMGHYRKDGTFAIDDVTGPDEYTCIVNNNYFTNAMAKNNLEGAVQMYREMNELHPKETAALMESLEVSDNELSSFEKAAEAMYLPYDEELNINPQDDTFLNKAVWDFENTPKENYPLLLHYHPLTLYRYQVCKQADTVLSHFLLEDYQREDTIRNSYHYYEGITTHDSSLSTCVFSMMAARLGELDKAYDYFKQTARLDLENTKGNTKDGLHMANMGGTWMAIVYGFAGLRIKQDGLHLTPKLPKQWDSYTFHIHNQGHPIKVAVTKGKVKLTLLEGEETNLHVNGEKITLHANEQTTIKL
ncbi:glycoside hydrolase family 65 protein [Thalassobacillus hwangdonensis]|uniref:Glycoside hydrolase family 65 protein n=1 Tax=Thalassobacillus hwangdonensis TaxID=546108 RepID=A0ABW3L233_9BACI